MSETAYLMAERIVIVDAGGRGHALAQAYLADDRVKSVDVVPGNDFMKVGNEDRLFTHSELKLTDTSGIVQLCVDRQITLADIAQDDAVAAGDADATRAAGILTLGPSSLAASIESSKIRGRALAARVGLNQPYHVACHSVQEGYQAIEDFPEDDAWVKADGSAAGKGAVYARNREEGKRKVDQMKDFKDAGKEFLVEANIKGDDGSPGEECSAFAINGELIGFAQDHKRVFDNDEGENTGGMGCVNYPMVVTPDIEEQVQAMFDKTVFGLAEGGTLYNGILYMGLMLVIRQGVLVPYLVEYNARWGDPEVEVLVPLKSSLLELSMAAAQGKPGGIQFEPDPRSRVVVAIASRGYPGDYSAVKDKEIFGIDEVRGLPDVRLYGAGVRTEEIVKGKYRYFANGGRLLYVVGEGGDILEARKNAYGAASLIHIEGNNAHYRKDIGCRDVERFYLQQAA